MGKTKFEDAFAVTKEGRRLFEYWNRGRDSISVRSCNGEIKGGHHLREKITHSRIRWGHFTWESGKTDNGEKMPSKTGGDKLKEALSQRKTLRGGELQMKERKQRRL